VTPVAVVENGTRENEIAAFGTLGGLPELIQAHGIQGPALLIIGEVAALAKRDVSAAVSGKAAEPTLSSLWRLMS
jgi:uroporphyrin-III C-methyltransferase/precorrin-2 dehydrogenase/sirohydrochlorin ferrochelatase